MDWQDFRAGVTIEISLNSARQEANSQWPSLEYLQWLEGRVNSIAFLYMGDERGLDALAAENEIKFLTGYAKRHGKFI